MAVRLWSWLVWALVGASAVFWALKLLGQPRPLPSDVVMHGPESVLQGDLARLLVGDQQAAAPTALPAMAAVGASDARLQLVGVLSPPNGPSGNAREERGLALIAIDGKPPRVFAVGEAVDGQRVLLGVGQRRADIGTVGQPTQLSLVIPAPGSPGAAQPAMARPPALTQPRPAVSAASAPR